MPTNHRLFSRVHNVTVVGIACSRLERRKMGEGIRIIRHRLLLLLLLGSCSPSHTAGASPLQQPPPSPPNIILVGANGALSDSAAVIQNFVLGGDETGSNASYTLSDSRRFSRLSWDAGAWGTQGGVITRKVMSLGSKDHHRLVRRCKCPGSVQRADELIHTTHIGHAEHT